jgi:hypothetical protein
VVKDVGEGGEHCLVASLIEKRNRVYRGYRGIGYKEFQDQPQFNSAALKTRTVCFCSALHSRILAFSHSSILAFKHLPHCLILRPPKPLTAETVVKDVGEGGEHCRIVAFFCNPLE